WQRGTTLHGRSIRRQVRLSSQVRYRAPERFGEILDQTAPVKPTLAALKLRQIRLADPRQSGGYVLTYAPTAPDRPSARPNRRRFLSVHQPAPPSLGTLIEARGAALGRAIPVRFAHPGYAAHPSPPEATVAAESVALIGDGTPPQTRSTNCCL